MNIFSYIMGSILAAASLFAGLFLFFFPPKKINAWYGISTKSTRKNQKTWNLGHRICAIALLIYAFFSILAYVLTLIIARDFFDEYWYLRIVFGCVYALVAALIGWAATEMELARLGKRTKKEKPAKEPKPIKVKQPKPATVKESKSATESDCVLPISAETPESDADASIEVVETAEVVDTESVAAPVVEPVAEAPAEPVVEPVAEVAAEPVVETVTTEIVATEDKTE